MENNTNKERYIAHLNKYFFEDGKMMLSPEINSCDFHKLTHLDTEILGMFCDKVDIHGEELKRVLLLGLIEYQAEKQKNEVEVEI